MRLLPFALMALAAAPFAQATEITVSFSDEMTETLEDDYGLREADYLTKSVVTDINQELAKRGVDVSRIDITIVDAKPTKPTFKQLGDRPGLDYGGSVSRGGMDMNATAYDAGGNVINDLDYDWYAVDIRDAGPTTWYDAKRASERFARKLADKLARN